MAISAPGPDQRVHVMRVYSRLEVGGIEHQMLTLLPRLNSGRYRVSVCLLKRAGELAEDFRSRGVAIHVLPFRGRLRPSSLVRLALLFRRTRTRIVHAHARGSNTSATISARLARVPVVIGAIHSLDTIRGKRRILQDRLLASLRDATVAVSEGVKRNYCDTVGIDPSRVAVIYNGVDLSRFEIASVDPGAILEPLGIPSGDRVVVCIGRLVPPKAHETLLAAAALVLTRASHTTFLLVGDGALREDLRSRARALGIADKVVFAGQRDDVPQILGVSDVSILTSTREGFSNVILESFAAGLPFVATDVGGNAEAIEDGVSGFIVPSGDVEGIAERVLRLVTDHALRSRMAEAAIQRAQRFSLEATACATESLYDRLLRARGFESPAAAG